LPNVGPYIYDVSISGFTRSSIYVYDISSLRVNNVLLTVRVDVIVWRKTNLMHKLFLVYFGQPLHFSGVSMPIIRRYNCMYTTIGTYWIVCCAGWIGTIQPAQQTVI